MAGSDQPLRLVMFDCDGTLIDSFGAVVAALQAAWKAVGRQPPAEYLLRETVGLPLNGAVMRLDPRLDEAGLDAIVAHYRKTLAVRDNVLMPGVRALIAELQQAEFLLGIATGMGRDRLDEILAGHDLSDSFDTLQTADTSPGKPNPQMLRSAMAELGVEPHHTVMVGDAVHDMAMARNAGVAGIGVTWGAGAGPTMKMAGADLVVDDFTGLADIIVELTTGGDGEAIL